MLTLSSLHIFQARALVHRAGLGGGATPNLALRHSPACSAPAKVQRLHASSKARSSWATPVRCIVSQGPAGIAR